MSKEPEVEDPQVQQITLPNGNILDYQYTNVWFQREHRANWEAVLGGVHLVDKGISIKRYLEIGVCEGSSMLWVLTNLQPEAAVGIDPWLPRACRRKEMKRMEETAKRTQTNAYHNLRYWIDEGTVTLLQADSAKALMGIDLAAFRESHPYYKDPLPDEGFDLIYVDGDHEALPALTDMVLAWRKLALGGIMILDDYNRRWLHGRPKSKEAIDAFLMAAESRYEFVYRGPRQVMIRRTK